MDGRSENGNLPDPEIDDLIHHLPAWVLGGLVNDYAGQVSIECLRAVAEVAAELKALRIIGEVRNGNSGDVEIIFDQEGTDSMLIRISSDGKVYRKSPCRRSS